MRTKNIDIRTRSVLRKGIFERIFKRRNADAGRALSTSLYELIAKSTFEEESLNEVIRIIFNTLQGEFSVYLHMINYEDECIDPHARYSIVNEEMVIKCPAYIPTLLGKLNPFQPNRNLGAYWNCQRNIMYTFTLIPHDFNIVSNDTHGLSLHQPVGIITPMVFQKKCLGMLEISGTNIGFNGHSEKEPFNLLLYSASVARIIAMHLELQSDPLTSLKTRRRYDVELPMKILRAINSGNPLSLIYIDADHFKSVNDTYGHGAGDSLLRFLAKQLSNSIRMSECEVFRIGGEEFAIIANVDRDDAICIANRISESVKKGIKIRDNDGNVHLIKPTVSIGIATLEHEPLKDNFSIRRICETMARYADNALYAAKNEYGRDCIVLRTREKGSIILKKV